jgi:transposase
MGNRIPVPLELDDFDVTDAVVVNGTLEVFVTSSFPRACHHCGSMSVIGHGRVERRLRHCPLGRPTVLVWRQRRFRCLDCDRTCRERHPALAGRKAITNSFRRQLFERACEQPFSHVAADEGVSNYRVLEAFEAIGEAELGLPIPQPRVLSLDESSFRRRFRFHTLVSDPEHKTLIAMGEGRNKAAAVNLLDLLDPSVKQGVETVVIDCHWPFRQAVEEKMPGVRIVADKFHVQRSVDQAAQRVRVRCAKMPPQLQVGRDGGTARQTYPRSYSTAYRARFVFAKRAEKLSVEEREVLDGLLWQFPDIHLAWLLKEQFATIYKAPNRKEAERRLDNWAYRVEACELTELKNVWKTLRHWREPILAYFDDRVNNGFAEGITNKIKVMKRMSYGFRNPGRYQRKVLLMSAGRRNQRATNCNS